MVGPWQVPVADLRGHPLRLLRQHRGGHGHGRAYPAGADQCPRLGAHGHRPRPSPTSPPRHRGSATSSCRPTGWPLPAIPARMPSSTTRSRAVGMELCPRPRNRDSGGQGLHVHEDRLGAGWSITGDDRPSVPDRLSLRTGGRRGRHPHAPAAQRSGRYRPHLHRPGQGAQPSRRPPLWPRYTARWAAAVRTWTTPRC